MTIKRLNIGILAHVDAGKTTLTEQLLFTTGALRTIGSVDKGTSATDNLEVERDRGISVRLSTAQLNYQSSLINIIDTPGHIDFCAEVEYSLRAMDAVVLLINAADGVQGHTISLFKAVKQLKIPCVLFINKIDRLDVDIDSIVLDVHSNLTDKALLLQSFIDQEIVALWDRNNLTDSIVEQIVEQDDELLEKYLDNLTLDFKQLDECLQQAISTSNIYPLLLGSAKNSLGVLPLLDLLVDKLAYQQAEDNQTLSAIVFKVEHDKSLGKLVYVRVFTGSILPRDSIVNVTRAEENPEKVAQIKHMVKGKYVDLPEIIAGDIGIVSGLSLAKVGDVLGEKGAIAEPISLTVPMLTVQVEIKDKTQIMQLVQAMTELCDQDPMLDMQWLPDIRELHIRITGMIQVEILQSILQQRYGLITEFSKPSIIYKETPSQNAFGYERYWMPKPCWAILKLLIEPTKTGSGVSFESKVSSNDVAVKYQKEVEQTIPNALTQGTKGWQVTDCKITLVEGEDHNVHSRSGDFIIATPMALMNGLVESGTTLLEPILSFTIFASLDLLGTITSDITKMRGTFNGPIITQDTFVLSGTVPAATSMDYPIDLASISSGKAKFIAKLDSYQPCSDELGQVTGYRGVNPLDRDKWILQARGAL